MWQLLGWTKRQWWLQPFDLHFGQHLHFLHGSLSWLLNPLASACAGDELQQSLRQALVKFTVANILAYPTFVCCGWPIAIPPASEQSAHMFKIIF
jgi:hypothetical protein